MHRNHVVLNINEIKAWELVFSSSLIVLCSKNLKLYMGTVNPDGFKVILGNGTWSVKDSVGCYTCIPIGVCSLWHTESRSN